MLVKREGLRVSVIEGRSTLWSGRMDGNISYPQDGHDCTRMINQCTDQELIHAVEQMLGARQTSKLSGVAYLRS
jgi:hypothetical protein